MDYEATDRLMSSWVVRARLLGTDFWLTEDGTISDIAGRCAVYRWADLAEDALDREMASGDWPPNIEWRVERFADS